MFVYIFLWSKNNQIFRVREVSVRILWKKNTIINLVFKVFS